MKFSTKFQVPRSKLENVSTFEEPGTRNPFAGCVLVAILVLSLCTLYPPPSPSRERRWQWTPSPPLGERGG